eukprot:6559886-Lingulodinium_polyedra.AAC.1
MTDKNLFYGMVCSVVSHVCDPVLRLLLEDDRVPMVLDELEELIQEKTRWLAEVPMAWFERLVSVLDPKEASCNATSLRNACLHGGHIAVGYMNDKICKHAKELP